jgi:long-chain acyl-CoA synthetase
MSKFPWLNHYPSDVPHELEAHSYRHLPGLLGVSSEKYAKTTAFTQCMPNGMNGSLSFEQVDRFSDHFAAYLREEAGLAAGDRVAVQMPNCLSYPIVAFGIMKAGCILVNTNPLYTQTEMLHQFSDSGASALVVIDMFADRLPEILNKTEIKKVVTVSISEFFPGPIAGIIKLTQKYWSKTLPKITTEHTSFREALNLGKKVSTSQRSEDYLVGVDLESIAALQYTGGTTGISKGAVLTHGNLVNNTLQMISMCGSYMRPGVEIVLTALPLYHIFAFTVNLLGFYHLGARNILVPSPRPPSNLKRAFVNYRVTWLSGVNTLFSALLNERWFTDSPPKYLRASAAGGMALHESVAKRWREVTGTPIVEGYGLTESSPVLTFNPLGGLQKDGTIGIPVPSTEVRCVDEEGNDVQIGQPGELIARGPQVMQGYWQQADESSLALRDGWLQTGDIAQVDSDGYFTIVDRKKDMILVSGFNVYPNEVEERIANVSGVREVGVIGIPDQKSGEKVWAYVVVSQPAPSTEDILSHCGEHMAAYKVPQHIIFVDELPKSPIGKILRRELRDGALASASSSNDSKGA